MDQDLKSKVAQVISRLNSGDWWGKKKVTFPLAKNLGTNKNTVADYAKGNSKQVMFETLDGLIKIYKVSPAWLYEGRGEMFQGESDGVVFPADVGLDSSQSVHLDAFVMLGKILGSGDDSIIKAIMSNLAVFSRVSNIEKGLGDKVNTLEKKVAALIDENVRLREHAHNNVTLRERIDNLEKTVDAVFEAIKKHTPPEGKTERRGLYRDLGQIIDGGS